MHTRALTRILTVVLAAVAAVPARADGLSFTSNSDGNKRVESCSDLHMTFWKTAPGKDGTVTVRRSEILSLGSDVSKSLQIVASDNSGIRVQPSMDGSLSALVCMAAGAASNEVAESILHGVSIENRDGHLTLDGPDGDWAATIVLSVPDGVTLDLSATNGGLQLRDVEGKFTLHTENGPIAMTHVGGVVDARTDNGAIQFEGHGGDVRLTAQTGPLDVDLDAMRWSGKGLDASTQTGPMTLTAPGDLKSGVEVRGSRTSPATWNGTPQPIEASGSRKFHFGGDEIVVRLSTMNGPLEIKAPKRTSGSVRI